MKCPNCNTELIEELTVATDYKKYRCYGMLSYQDKRGQNKSRQCGYMDYIKGDKNES